MTSLLKYNLHQMVNFASGDKVVTACVGREDVCRFLLHSYMDYMTDRGLYDSSFEVLIDWSKQLNVKVDDKKWKVSKPTEPRCNPLLENNSRSDSNSRSSFKQNKKSSFKRKKKDIKIKLNKKRNANITPPNSVSVTPISDKRPIDAHLMKKRDRVCSYSDDECKTIQKNKFVKYSKYTSKPKTDAIIILESRRRAKSHGTFIKKRVHTLDTLHLSSTSPAITPHDAIYADDDDEDNSDNDEEEEEEEAYNWSMALEHNNNNNNPQTANKRRLTNDSEISEWNVSYQRKWSDDDEDVVENQVIDNHCKHRRDSSVSIGDHEKNLIVAHHAKNILSNIDEDEKYSISRVRYVSDTNTNTNTRTTSCLYIYDDMHMMQAMDYISKLSHSIWLLIAQFLNTSSKAAGLGLVNREMNLLCSHPSCWKKLRISIDNLTKISLNVMRRSLKCLTRFELNWNNPETPLSLLYGSGNNIYHINNRINGYMALKYSKEIELFFSNLSSVCHKSLHTFKLSQHGGPYRLANSAPTSIKIFQTETLLRLVFSNFSNLRKFKMDAYNLIAVDVFTSLIKKYAPSLQFFESQIVVYDRQQQRVILENPVLLNDVNLLPASLRHLCLPLLADDSWIINQHLPNLEYLFFFGYTRSSGYALHENFLSIRCLDYIAGQKSPAPNCPKIKIIEIALRQNDYLTIILRPIIRKLFLKCHYLQSVKLATAGNLDLAQNLYKSLYASNLGVCNVFAKDEGRPEKPIGVVEFRRNPNYKFIVHHAKHSTQTHLSVPNVHENEETVSEMAVGGRLRG